MSTNLYKSLASFQQEVPVIHKDTQGYGYTYADLPAIFEIINPILKKHNLGFTQPIVGKEIHTTIFHTETGEKIESSMEFPEGVQLKGMNEYQVLGSAITYLRRYALSSILGLVTDKDTDGNGIEQKQSNNSKNQTTSKPPEKWLNINSDEWRGLVKSVEAGASFTLDQIKKKYKIREDVKKELEKLNIF